MAGHHIMVVLIVTIVMITSVLRARYKAMAVDREQNGGPEAQRLREELKTLRDRVAVLERIATDKEHLLANEIERLRDR